MKFLSALVTQGSGVMGNLVVEKNGVIRNRNTPANPRSLNQQQARSRLSNFAASWSADLSDAQRLGWNEYAATVIRNDALGKPIKLTGIDMFVSANAASAIVGGGAILDRPTDDGGLSLPPITGVVIDDSANTLVATFADVVPATVTLSLYLSPGSVSVGRSRYAGPYRFNSNAAASGTTTVTFTIGGAPVTGEKWGWRIAAVNDQGQVARASSGLNTVVA